MERQLYRDCTYEQAVRDEMEVIQLKYDGWWSRIHIKDGVIKFHSRTGRVFKEEPTNDFELDCVLVGEHMFGTQWAQHPDRIGSTFLFDVWKVGIHDLSNTPYTERWSVLRSILQRLPSKFHVIANYPMSSYHDLWALCDSEDGFEGLVYRKKRAIVPVCIFRQKVTFTEDLIAIDFLQGEGKYSEVLGAIQGATSTGVLVKVGGGFNDEDRQLIWGEQDFYRGKVFEVEARKKFESGSLRSPNFVRWRSDLISPSNPTG